MFNTKIMAAVAATIACVDASHLDNINGVFDTFSFDAVKFKTRTNCSLDKYPEVSCHLPKNSKNFELTRM